MTPGLPLLPEGEKVGMRGLSTTETIPASPGIPRPGPGKPPLTLVPLPLGERDAATALSSHATLKIAQSQPGYFIHLINRGAQFIRPRVADPRLEGRQDFRAAAALDRQDEG